jgi:glycerate kinase
MPKPELRQRLEPRRVRRLRRGDRASVVRDPWLRPALVAPNSFKGTFSAREVAGAIAAELRAAGGDAHELPVADGGEGTMDALLATVEGEVRAVEARDPLGRLVQASFALIDGGRTGVVETAQASGLGLVGANERDAWAASTAPAS